MFCLNLISSNPANNEKAIELLLSIFQKEMGMCASLRMTICLAGNGDVTHQEWECDSLGMGCDSRAMQMLSRNAHSLYKV